MATATVAAGQKPAITQKSLAVKIEEQLKKLGTLGKVASIALLVIPSSYIAWKFSSDSVRGSMGVILCSIGVSSAVSQMGLVKTLKVAQEIPTAAFLSGFFVGYLFAWY